MKIKMLLQFFVIASLSTCIYLTAHASQRKVPVGKPVYCDTSAGRTVLDNGSYSKLYCRNYAVMDLQTLHGCCSWAGGVLAVKNGAVICRNGTLSAVCSLQSQDSQTDKNFDGTVTFNEPM